MTTTSVRSDSPPDRTPQPEPRAALPALFVYGTLTDDTQVQSLTGRRFPRRPATLEGFARILPARGYAYIVPDPGGSVEGFILEEIDAASLRALDAYEDEGRLYLRRPVIVSVDGRRVACEAYVRDPRRSLGAVAPSGRVRTRRQASRG